MDWESVCSGHDGLVAAGQSVRGDDDNSRGSEHALGLNAWLGIGYRPAGSTLGLSQSLQGSGAVWVVLGGLSFFWAARRSRFSFNTLSLFFIYYLRLACFAFSGSLSGISNNTDHGPGL